MEEQTHIVREITPPIIEENPKSIVSPYVVLLTAVVTGDISIIFKYFEI